MWEIDSDGSFDSYCWIDFGVRPVVTLKSNIRQVSEGHWEILP